MASREIFWNIQLGGIVYLLGFIVIAVACYALYRRFRLWRVGSEDDRLNNLGSRIRVLVGSMADGLWHRRIVRDRYAGAMHLLIFGGFGLLLMGPFLDFMSEHVVHFMKGNVYLGVSLMLDMGGLLVLAGIGLAAYRRYVVRPTKLNNLLDDAVALTLLAVIIVTGFAVEGARIAATELDTHLGWAVWSPVGFVFALAFSVLGHDAALVLHKSLWWGHMLISFGAMAYVFVSFPKLAHIIASPLNMFLKSTNGKGVLKPIEITEEVETFGASKIQDLTWKDLLDLDACTRCGRCQAVCPAYLTGKPLSPKKLIQELKANLVEQAPALLRHKRDGEGADACPLVDGVVSEDELWACTSCAACEEACPVYVEPISKIIAMRRNLVLEQGKMPGTAMSSLRSVQDRGHPWKGTQASRMDWAEGLQVKPLSSNGTAGILFWVGCTAAVQERGMNIPASLVKILGAAGVEVGLLGHEESCCGHFARRLGDEYLFQCQAKQNIETLQRYNVKKIVTICPHCYHTLKDEYPQFGGDFEVVHHTELILQLINEGKLKFSEELNKVVAYQDPCYLGRYHGIYEAPRKILEAIPGIKVVEMAHCRSESLCCGAGGGHMWIEEEPSQRVSGLRMKDALDTKADILITACPFCMQMFEDAAKGLEDEQPMEVLDLVELLERVVAQPVVVPEPVSTSMLEVTAVTDGRPLSIVGGDGKRAEA
jgi:Fe-S oxidoreductase/nitrate reductase gamma subunit